MSFDKPTRNKLAAMVGDCRRLLTADIRDQLQVMYGLQPDGTALPMERLARLDDQDIEVARELREWEEHLASSEIGTETQKMKAGFDRVAHETAFTVLNRLAALRMCEERGHVIECVRRGMESDGFVLYERLSGGVFGARGETYRIFLERMFNELAVDLGVLFDRSAPQALIFPRERCIEEVFSVLNSEELTHLWKEDETIGWIYQYFNSKDEREAMRAASAAPRNSRELAVRNQFFTPRHVVEFLVDNTLGRIWYEMRKGDTALKDGCRYFVRRPTEIFLKEGEEAPPSSNAEENLSQEELLKQPVYIPYRPKKDPRDLRILDPACGSGHFLLYAFDLLETIYEEAWADERPVKSESTGKALREEEEYADLSGLKRAVPELILRHNLHGVDIDLRACQIAALALWLRSQRTYQRLGLKPPDRPKITRSNIVCAEPMPGEQQLLDQFVCDLQPKVLGQLVQVVFEKMKLAGEAGALLKIEEEIVGAVAEAKKKWLAGPKPEQTVLFGDFRSQQTELNFDFSGLDDDTFWEKAEARIYAELQSYAEGAENGHGYQRRLFAEDAAQGFAFIDLCRKSYDAVLMNPPFGECSKLGKSLIFEQYPSSKYDLGSSFAERAAEFLCSEGIIGSLANRSIFFGQLLEDWRRAQFVSNGSLHLLGDLGVGVLDSALVEAVAYTFSYRVDRPSLFFKAVDSDLDLFGVLSVIRGGRLPADVHLLHVDVFDIIPGFPFAYWTPQQWLGAYTNFRTLESQGFVVRQGMESSDNFRFVRLWWELPAGEEKWRPYSKGGWFGPHWHDMDVSVNWGDSGREVKEFSGSIYGTWTKQITNTEYYGVPGLCYPAYRVEFSPRVLPRDCVVGCKGPIIALEKTTPHCESTYLALLAVLSSSAFRAMLNLTTTSGDTMRKIYRERAVASVPMPSLEQIGEYPRQKALAIVNCIRSFDSLIETCRLFLTLGSESNRGDLAVLIRKLRKELDDAVCTHYGFSGPGYIAFEQTGYDDLQETTSRATDEVVSFCLGCAFGRWDVRFATGERKAPELPDPFSPLPACPPGMLHKEQALPVTEGDVERLQAHGESQYPLEIPWDGILVDDADHPDDIIRRVRVVLTVIWKDRAESIEQEACEVVGVKDLREYFRKPSLFLADHLKRYSKSRRQAPIYWPLSTASGSYTLWIYYHRLNHDLLYTALNKYVKPKIDATEKELRRIESEVPNASGRDATALRAAFERTTNLLEELRGFRDELARVAELPYKPNLNDGVLITASPLWKLFRLPKWRKDLQDCWKNLESGAYDWSHLAYSIWPDRVREVCRHDRSIAIAHGLEELCEITPKPAKKRSKKEKIEETVPGDEE